MADERKNSARSRRAGEQPGEHARTGRNGGGQRWVKEKGRLPHDTQTQAAQPGWDKGFGEARRRRGLSRRFPREASGPEQESLTGEGCSRRL